MKYTIKEGQVEFINSNGGMELSVPLEKLSFGAFVRETSKAFADVSELPFGSPEPLDSIPVFIDYDETLSPDDKAAARESLLRDARYAIDTTPLRGRDLLIYEDVPFSAIYTTEQVEQGHTIFCIEQQWGPPWERKLSTITWVDHSPLTRA